jgi:coenzyme F420-reducing hydrogenase delta subunit
VRCVWHMCGIAWAFGDGFDGIFVRGCRYVD